MLIKYEEQKKIFYYSGFIFVRTLIYREEKLSDCHLSERPWSRQLPLELLSRDCVLWVATNFTFTLRRLVVCRIGVLI